MLIYGSSLNYCHKHIVVIGVNKYSILLYLGFHFTDICFDMMYFYAKWAKVPTVKEQHHIIYLYNFISLNIWPSKTIFIHLNLFLSIFRKKHCNILRFLDIKLVTHTTILPNIFNSIK